MTDAEALCSFKKLKRMVVMLFRISSAISLAKAESAQNGNVFTGWTARFDDIGHTGPMERSVGVFDIYWRFSESGHCAEYVLADADGDPIIVLPCTHFETVDVLGRRKRRSYKIVAEGATIVLAA